MTTLTTTGTFSVGDAPTPAASVSLVVGAPIGGGMGKGRLVHPSLGILDYEFPPDRWVNMNGDAIIPPVWGSNKTLKGAVNTLFVGDIRDVMCEEHWNQDVAMPMSQLQAMLSFWTNAPDPSVGYVHWYPSYVNGLGFKVVLLDLTVGGQGVAYDFLSFQGFVREEVVLKMRITGRV